MLLPHRCKDKTCPQTARGEAHLLAQREGGNGVVYRGLLGTRFDFKDGAGHERWPFLNQARGSAPKLKKLLTSQNLLIPLANFIEATGRLDLEGGPATVSGTH